jgi:DNA-binding CsgD family transcriptional regulator
LACPDLRPWPGGFLAQQDSLSLNPDLFRDPCRGPLGPGHESLLARLSPHFDRALRLMAHIHAATQARNQALAWQDASALSLITVNATGHLLHSNRNGEVLLKSASVLRARNGLLECACDDQQSKFATLLDAIARTRRSASLLLHPRLQPECRYSATLTPAPGHSDANGPPGEILCLVVPLDQRRIATAHQLMQLFALSAAEARLARALAAGQTIEAYAQENGLRLPTVKSQLHAAFEKTGTDRQAALVRLITGIPAVREPQ